MNLSHFVRTDWLYRTIFGFASLCMAQLYNPLRVLSKTQPLIGAMGYGYWLLAIGYGLWAGACGVATIHASNLSPYRPFSAKGSVLTQMP